MLVLLGTNARGEPACLPVARVSGDPVLEHEVVKLLRERGLPVAGESPCGTVDVVLIADADRVRLTLRDGQEPPVDRVADDVEAAATVIESWARRDVSAPLLAAREAPAPPVQRADRERPPQVQAAAGAPAAPGRRLDLAGALEASLSDDGGLWTGIHAQACLELGPLCLGALVRYAVDTEQSGDSKELATARWMVDMFLRAELPLRWGAFTLSPGLAAGQSAVRADRDVFANSTEDQISGFQARADLDVRLALGRPWSLRLDLAVAYTPVTSGRLGHDGVTLAGMPETQLSLGVGLAYGGL